MKKVKVVHVITKMELGGAQQNTLFTVSNLNPDKFEAFLVTGTGGELYAEAKAFKNTFTVKDLLREVRPVRDLKAFCRIIKILKKIKQLEPCSAPLIVHTHSSKAGIIGRWAAKAAGIPIIIHSIHGFGFNPYQSCYVRRFFILLEHLTSYITTKFIAVSKANIDQGVKLKIFPRRKAKLIRSGIDIAKFKNPAMTRPAMRRHFQVPENEPLVAMIACLKPQKAPLDYVRVCDLVNKEVTNAHFFLIGDGILRAEVERQVLQRGLQHNFHLLGWRRDIPEILNAIDVLALTSLWEGLPRVLPQAMSAGVPIVATCVDGSSEAVRDGWNGFLAAPGDIAGIAKKIIFLLKDPGKAQEMAQKGLQMVEEFDIHKMVKDQEKLYAELQAGV